MIRAMAMYFTFLVTFEPFLPLLEPPAFYAQNNLSLLFSSLPICAPFSRSIDWRTAKRFQVNVLLLQASCRRKEVDILRYVVVDIC
jgi:hypothetical protein